MRWMLHSTCVSVCHPGALVLEAVGLLPVLWETSFPHAPLVMSQMNPQEPAPLMELSSSKAP